jgi:type IV pilus assembly protein PilY1
MGGVLRKKAAQLAGNTTATDNEFSEDTGVFNTTVTSGVIKTIDAFRVSSASYGYTASQGDVSYSGNSDWRNPIGEIYAETLRYILGRAAPTSGFDSDDTWAIPGITRETTWNDPVPANLWCSKCSIILISSGPNSFDNDNIDPTKIGETTASLTRTTLNTLTDTIGLKEFGAISNSVFYGGSNVSTQCSIASKKLSELLGKCPELPTSLGTYDVAGLAYWAHTTDQRTAAGYSGNQTISTYSVELSEGLPSLDIPIGNKKVSLVPVCTNANTSRCSLVGVAVENLVTGSNGAPVSGSYLFYWEDQPWASDYDLDAVQRIQFCVGSACGSSAGVNSDEIKITNTLPYWATGTGSMFMHYIISGTDTTTAPYTTTYIGPQSDQAVHRGGYSQHNLGVISSLNSWSWYNTILPQGTDALPANTTADKYTMSKVFKAGTDTVTKVNTPLFYAAKYGSFKDTDTSHYPDTAAKWDVKNLKGEAVADGIPDNYFMMKNPSLLEDRLWDIFHDAVHDVASGSGVSTNSTKLETDTRIYQARFYTDSWYGELKSLKLSNAATSDYQTDWTTLNVTLTPASRNITSYSSGAGIEFVNSGFNAKYTSAQKTALGGNTEGPKVIDWVRGNDVTGYRKRLTQDNGRQLMGDIVNSTPVYAGAASQGYESLEATYGSETYADYVKNVKATRKSVIYVGANDGMLHAIDSQNGEELFAYVPSMIYSALPKISAAGYGSTISHVYSVDGPITVGDAFINGSWKTILVGTLGAGAQGFFVLDVTDPEHFSKSKVLFEIGAGDYNAVGNIMGKPLIAPVAGRWKIVVGNGYNSSEGYAQLLVIDIAAPSNSTHSKVIKAGTVNNNGLGSAVALQNTSTKAVDYIYAGDLLGNMWKFDLSSSNSSNWGVTLNNKPLFTAKDPLGNAQPIFASPTLGRNSHLPSATMVYFGTGKYMEAADIGSTEMAKVQTFYGVADEGVALTYSGSRAGILHEKTMVTSAFTRDVNDLGGSAVAIDWEHKKGWFLDFPAGERMVTKPLMLYNRLIFPTIVPNTDVCSFGGAGWLMELVAVDDLFGVTDQLLPMNGTHLDYFLPGDLTKLKSDAGTVLNECNIKGDCSSTILNDPKVTSDSAGRVSWRQVH